MWTYVRYRNAGHTKIDDRAMLWMLWAFVAYPMEGARLHFWCMRVKCSFIESLAAWQWLWQRNTDVWNSL